MASVFLSDKAFGGTRLGISYAIIVGTGLAHRELHVLVFGFVVHVYRTPCFLMFLAFGRLVVVTLRSHHSYPCKTFCEPGLGAQT